MKIINKLLFRVLESKYLFILTLTSMAIFMLPTLYYGHNDYFVILQSFLIGLTSLALIVNKKSGLLAQVVGVFFLVAFSYFPILEVLTSTIYWSGEPLNFFDRVTSNYLIFIFLLLFCISYVSNYRLPTPVYSLKFPTTLSSIQSNILFVVAISSLYYLAFLYSFNFLTFFFRGGENATDLDVELKSSYLLVEFFLRPLIFNIGLLLFYFSRRHKIFRYISLGIGVIAIFPTGVPRFLAAALYIPFILHWAFSNINREKSKLRFPRLFLPSILLFGLFFIFPLLDIFRSYSTGDEFQITVFGLNTMLAGHFDSYQMLVRAISHGELTYGFGFLGALLFFVPRAIWTSKPIGSAQEVAGLSNLSLDNVSMPLVAEFYLNFWYFGVLLGALFLGLIIRSIDLKFMSKSNYDFSFQWIFYFQTSILLLFVLRGSFLSAFAYSISIALTWVVIWFVCKFPVLIFHKNT